MKKIPGIILLVLWPALALAEEAFEPPPHLQPDTLSTTKPDPRKDNPYGDAFNRLFTRPFVNTFDLSYQMRRAAGEKPRAYDIDPSGEVGNSAWFTPRIGNGRMTPQEVAVGPNTGDGPDTLGEWLLVDMKKTGTAPGFRIQDASGEVYLIKFDPPGYPELATGAEVVSTKLLHAAGYNVPENYISVLDPARIRIAPDVSFRPAGRKPKRLLTRSDLDSILSPFDRRPDGKIRVLASRELSGIPLGGFKFKATRPDDPNDLVPHEHRRELRGFYVIGSWINHWDNNIGNTLDMYDTAAGQNHVKHYFVDFSNTLGSSGVGPQPNFRNNVRLFEFTRILKNLVTLGFNAPSWEKYDTIPLPSVGAFESVTYNPTQYQFTYPSLAFDYMTDEDAFWAAKIVTSFSDEHLVAAAQAGQYADPNASIVIARVLSERRDKIGQTYFRRTNPVDKFALVQTGPDQYELQFADLAAERGIYRPANAQYEIHLPSKPHQNGNGNGQNGAMPKIRTVNEQYISFSPDQVFDSQKEGVAVLRLRTLSPSFSGGKSKETRVFLSRNPQGELSLMGIER